jgi:hypothetical protein
MAALGKKLNEMMRKFSVPKPEMHPGNLSKNAIAPLILLLIHRDMVASFTCFQYM